MTATIVQAAREMEELFRNVWGGRPCDYPNLKNDNLPPADKSIEWARFSIQHDLFQQASLAAHDGKRRFNREGFVYIQLFFPLNTGVIGPYTTAESVVKAYEGKQTPSGVWFRNVRFNEINSQAGLLNETNSGLWFNLLVIAEFTFDNIH